MRQHWTAALLAASLLAFPATPHAQESGMPPAVASAGVTLVQWQAVERQVQATARRADISERALLAAAWASGERFAASGRFNALSLQSAITEALDEQAEQITELEARLQALTGDSEASIAQVYVHARRAINEGRFADADRLLADVAERDLAALQSAEQEVERRRLRAGETVASRGQVAFLQSDFLGAANHFARAADVVPQRATRDRWQYRLRQSEALHARGLRFGEPAPLREAVRLYRDIGLPLVPRERAPADWAVTQNNLGNVLLVLGRRGDDQALRDAIAAYRAALEVRTRARAPADWARTQINLANALGVLGARGDDQALRDAIAAYRAALEVLNRSSAPANWATAQNNLGTALQSLGERSRDNRALRDAIVAYRAALEVRTRSSAPADWAATQNNLGVALLKLGERNRDNQALRDAIAAYRAALEVRTRARAPADWGMTQNNLGIALFRLGERGDDRALRDAIVAYRAALEVFTRASVPVDWASTTTNLGNALWLLGERGDDQALRDAIAAYRAALEVRTRARAPADWAETQFNLAMAHRAALRRGDRAQLAPALEAARAAQSGFEQIQNQFGVSRARRLIRDLERRR